MGVLLGLQQLALLAHLSEAVAAVNGTIRLGLEGNLSLTTAGGAGGGEELTGATGGVLAGIAAGLAALGLVLEAALSVELLLTGSEGELVAALFTGQNLIFVHGISLSLTRAQVWYGRWMIYCDQLSLVSPDVCRAILRRMRWMALSTDFWERLYR